MAPIPCFERTDRFIFQTNFGKGVARYINDLKSLGGQDALFDDSTGPLDALAAGAAYIYIYGTRENKDGRRGSSDQFQLVGIFRFQPAWAGAVKRSSFRPGILSALFWKVSEEGSILSPASTRREGMPGWSSCASGVVAAVLTATPAAHTGEEAAAETREALREIAERARMELAPNGSSCT